MSLLFNPHGEPGRWAARVASQNVAHRCRHCDQAIVVRQHYLVELGRPWLILHFDCLLRLGRDVVKAEAAFDRLLEDNDDELTTEVLVDWLALTEFMNALATYQVEIEQRRRSIELYMQGNRPDLLERVRPKPRRPRARKRG